MEWKVPLIRPNPLWEVEPHTAVAARAQQKTSGQQLREDRIVTEQQRQHRLYKTKSKSSCKLQTLDDDGDAHWGSSTSVGSSAVTSAPFCVPFAQSCLTFCDPMDYSPPSSSVHGIFQAIILEGVAISFSKGSSNPGTEPGSPELHADSLSFEPPGKPYTTLVGSIGSEIKRRLLFGRKAMTNLDRVLKTRDITLPTKVCIVKGMGFSSHVQMWELDHKEDWAPKNWYFWIVVLEKTLEHPLDCTEIKPTNPKGNQSWIFIGRTDAGAEATLLWLLDVKSQLIGKTLMLGKNWGKEEKWATEDEMVKQMMLTEHYQLSGHEFEQIPAESGGQENPACCSPQGRGVGLSDLTKTTAGSGGGCAYMGHGVCGNLCAFLSVFLWTLNCSKILIKKGILSTF